MAVPDKDLMDPARFSGMPADWEPWQVIASNTYEHYGNMRRRSANGWRPGQVRSEALRLLRLCVSPNPALGVAALSAATLLLESTLTRLLAVAQFYHFAFLVVSLALLGFGASGTLLSLAPRRSGASRWTGCWPGRAPALPWQPRLAYAVVNWLPFDSYRIAWDRRQILCFLLYYLALTLPFVCGGLARRRGVGGERRAQPPDSMRPTCSARRWASLLAPAALWLAGVPGAVLASVTGRSPAGSAVGGGPGRRCWPAWPVSSLLSVFNLDGRGVLGMIISPYKGLASAWRYPGSQEVFGRWDAVARVDVVAGAGTRLLPGLSYTYAGAPPPQQGLSVDADALQPVTSAAPADFEAAAFMPEAVAFQLRPAARVLGSGAGRRPGGPAGTGGRRGARSPP